MVDRAAEAADFLRLLWPEAVPGCLPIWWKSRAGSGSSAAPLADLADLAREAVRHADQGRHVYVACALQAERPEKGRRGSASGACAVPGLWADLDVAGPAHRAADLAPTKEDAADLARRAPWPPTVLVDSGHGLQGWWLFERPWVLADEEDRRHAADLVARLQAFLRGPDANPAGWIVDPTADLARVLRLPGSLNWKLQHRAADLRDLLARREDAGERRELEELEANGTEPAPVRVLALDDAERRSPEEWHEALAPLQSRRALARVVENPAPPAPTPGRPSLEERAATYLRAMGPAVQGAGGDLQTTRAAWAVAVGFGLPEPVARRVLEEWDRGNVPPWGDTEPEGLQLKLQSALQKAGSATDFGALAREERQPGKVLPWPPPPPGRQEERATAGNLALAPAPGLKGYDFHRSDPGQAEFVLAFSGDRLRHCPPLRHPWLVWSGTHWEPDRTNLVHQIAIDAARQRLRDAVEVPDDDRRKTEIAFALSCHSAGKRKAVVETASVLQRVNVLPRALDADPWVLNCTNGTLDLRSGKLRPHRREDFLTKLAPVAFDESAACPLWEKFLLRSMGGDQELISYLARVAGYCLTGSTREEVLFVLHGRGRNGKGVYSDTLAAMLGELAERVPADLFCNSRRNADSPSPHLAKLPGVRLVNSSETEEGRRLDEAFIKLVTGGDDITAHAKFCDPTTFKPAFKLLLSTNHRPEIRGTDEGIWSRIHLVPWAVVIPEAERDKDLKAKLLAELPGVLAWAVRGCLEWQRVGLKPPAAVLAATQTYRQDSDALAAFLAERTTTEETLPPGALFVEAARVLHGDLWSSYQAWCRDSGEPPMRSRDFSRALDERGFPSRKGAKNKTFRLGIRLLADDEVSPEGDAEGGLPRLPGLPTFQKKAELPSLEGQPENWVTQVTQVTHQEEGEPEEPGDPGWELLL